MSGPRWSLVFLALLATESRAQTVLLELRPRAGDTLRMRLDQTTEMTGARRGAKSMQVTTTLRMFSRAIVEQRMPTATRILAITDSVDMTTSDAHAQAIVDQAEAQLEGRQIRLRLWPNGTVSLSDEPQDVPREVSDLVAVMPASFPKEPVSVGDTWVREMPIPAGARFGIALGGVVRSTFRLDSVSRGGEYAYVSMRGTLHANPPVATDPETLGGSVNGSMVIDRLRGWLRETRFLIQMRTSVPSQSGARGSPTRFVMKITQHMRVFDKRP